MCNLKIQNSSHMKNIGTPNKPLLVLLPKTKIFGPLNGHKPLLDHKI